jgi:hypothetical protein
MRNLQEVLLQKEMALARVRQEVEALRFVAPLLLERDDQFTSPQEQSWSTALPRNRWPLEVEDRPQIAPGL